MEPRGLTGNIAAVRGKENRLEEIPATEEWLHIEALNKQASGDGLPDKLSLLRQKLSHKAKQEPKFRFYVRKSTWWRRWIASSSFAGRPALGRKWWHRQFTLPVLLYDRIYRREVAGSGMGTGASQQRRARARETNWVVGGPSGAAARLGLPRTSLIARMQRLGLAKYPGTQNERPPAQHEVERWIPDSAEDHLVSAAGAGYGSSVTEYSYVRKCLSGPPRL